MFSIKQINETIAQGQSLLFVAQSYSEVAAARLKRIRRGIERNRDFLSEIVSMYATVKLVAAQRKVSTVPTTSPLLEKASRFLRPGPKPISSPRTNKAKSTINIILTSNYRFYGSLELDLIEFFLKNNQRFQAQTIVVGKTGDTFLRAIGFRQYSPIIFKTDLPTLSQIKGLIDKMQTYDRVLVYHSKFQSVLHQAPFIRDIKEAQFEVSIPKRRIDYIFEPEIDKMLLFFDSQISSLLLEQSFLEAQLARTAARLIAMNDAQDNAKDFIEKEEKSLGTAKRSLANIRLLESIAGSSKARRAMYELV